MGQSHKEIKSSSTRAVLPRKNHKVKKELAPTATIRGTSTLEPPQDEAQIRRYSSLTAFTNGTRSNWYQVIFLRQRQLKCESWALSLLFWHRPGIPLYDMVFFLESGPRAMEPGLVLDLCPVFGTCVRDRGGLVGRILYRNRRHRTRGKRVRTTPGISSVKKLLTGPIPLVAIG